MTLNNPQKICLGFFICLLAFLVTLFIHDLKYSFYNDLFSFVLALIPLIGGAFVIVRSRLWGYKRSMGKGMLFLGLGSFCWGIGEIIWSYYVLFLNTPVPYPSLADVGYAPSMFFYAVGTLYFSKATGNTFKPRREYSKLVLGAIPFATLLISYYLLIVIGRHGALASWEGTTKKTIFDVVYPLGYFIGFTIALMVSSLRLRYLKGRYKTTMLALLLGFTSSVFSDSLFSYSTSVNTYYNGGLVDLLFLIDTFLFVFAALGLYTPEERDTTPSWFGVYGNRVVLTSTAEDFALVVKNRQLAEALRKAFNALKRKWSNGAAICSSLNPYKNV